MDTWESYSDKDEVYQRDAGMECLGSTHVRPTGSPLLRVGRICETTSLAFTTLALSGLLYSWWPLPRPSFWLCSHRPVPRPRHLPPLSSPGRRLTIISVKISRCRCIAQWPLCLNVHSWRPYALKCHGAQRKNCCHYRLGMFRVAP